MSKPLIKGTPMYINPYEAAYDKLKDKTIFNQYDWNYALRNSEEDLQTYIGILTDSDKLSYDQLNQKYLGLIERMDTDQRLFMYQNELYGDKSDESRKAREIIVDYDADGNPIKESIEMTDYEYNSKMLEDWAKYQNELDIQRLKQYEKDNANFGEWLLYSAGTVGSVLLERPTKGAIDIIGSFFDLVDAIPAAIFTEDTFRERMSDDSIFGIDYWKFSDDWEKNFVDWASTNTWLYDTKGQANWVANIATSTAYSIGQMAPSIAIGYLTGGLGSAVGLSSTAIQWTSAIAQQGFYYAGMASQNLRESFKAAGTDVATYRILSKVALQTGLDYIVEQCSAKMFGASMMDKLVLGMTRRGSNGNAVLNVFKEALIEGAEETVQEFTSWFAANIHAGFDENDPLYQAFDLQTMVDAAICGALSSIALGTSNTIVEQISKNKYMNKLTKDDIIYLELIKSDKSKAKDYKHGLYAFMEDYGNVIQNIKNNPPKNSKQMQLAMELTQNMYTSYNTLMAIFEEYGGEKVKNAEMYLSKLNEIANRTAKKATEVDKTDFKTNMENFAKLLVENIQDQTIVQKIVSEIQKNVKDNKITRKELGQAVSIYLKNKQEFANSKQSEKAINTAKKLAAEGKDIVLTDTSATILEFGDVIFVPLPDIENLEADEILKAAETRTIVNTLIEQMPKNVLDFIVDKYKTTINSKTDKTSTDTVRAVYNMLFNQSFYNILLQTADVDSINLITMLDNVVSIIAESTKNVEPYKNIINNVRKTMGASIVYYLCNNTNIDLASITVLNDAQKKFVYEHRYNSMLADRIIANENVTEQDLNVIRNRINALVITKKEKERLYNNITSDIQSQRRHGIAELDNAYYGAFKGKYNDKIYMSGTDNKSALFNEFARLNGIDLTFFKGTKTNSDLEIAVKEKYGTYNYTNKIKYLKEKFELFTNNNYTLDVVGTNKDVVVSEKDDAALVNVFSMGEGLKIKDIKASDSMDRTYFKQSLDDTGVRNIYDDILSKDITDFEKAYLSMDTIISNPNKYLSKDIKSKINEQYGPVNKTNAYSYLSNHIATNVDGYGLTILNDGRIIVANYGHTKSFLKDDILKADKNTNTLFEKFKKDGIKGIPITEFIKDELLTPELKNIVVYVTESDTRSTSFNSLEGEHYIIINAKSNLKLSNALFRNALMHEFNHALQQYSNIAEGFDDNYVISDNVVADIKKHVPQLFENITSKANTEKGRALSIKNQEIECAKDFIYYNSVGELESVGKSVNNVDIYPIVIKTIGNTSKITMPWGSTYTLSGTGANRTMKAKHDSGNYGDGRYGSAKKDIKRVNKAKNYVKTVDEALKIAKEIKDIQVAGNKIKTMFVKIGLNNEDAYKLAKKIVQGKYSKIDDKLYQSETKVIRTYKIPDKVDEVRYNKAKEYTETITQSLAVVKNAKDLSEAETTIRKKLKGLGLVQQEIDSIVEKMLRNEYYVGKDDIYQTEMSVMRKYKRDKEKFDRRAENKRLNKLKGQSYDSKNVTKTMINELGTDTALQYYSPEKHEHPRRLTLRMIKFLASLKEEHLSKLDELRPDLVKNIRKGKATQNQVFEFIRSFTDKDVPDWIFNIIKNSFFPDTPFKNFDEVRSVTMSNMSIFWALSIIFRSKGLEQFLDNDLPIKLTEKGINDYIEQYKNTFVNLKDDIEKLIKRYEYSTEIDPKTGKFVRVTLNINQSQGLLTTLRYYDGSIDSIAKIANVMRLVARSHWNVAGSAKELSLDAPIDNTKEKGASEDTVGETIADKNTGEFVVDDKLSLKQKREDIVNNFSNKVYEFEELFIEEGESKNVLNLLGEVCFLIDYNFSKLNNKQKQEYVRKIFKKLIFAESENVKFSDRSKRIRKNNFTELIKQYTSNIENLTEKNVLKLHTRLNLSQDFGLNEEIIAKSEALEDAFTSKPNAYRRLKGKIDTALNGEKRINRNRWKRIDEQYKKYFVETKKGNTYTYDFNWSLIQTEYSDLDEDNKRHIASRKSIEDIEKVEQELNEFFNNLKRGVYDSKESSRVNKDLEKALKENAKLRKKLAVAEGKIKYRTTINSNTTFEMHSDVEMPSRLESIMNTTFDDDATSTTKFLTKPDERHMVTSATKFFEQNAKELDALTAEEVEKAIDFFENAVFNPNASKEDMVRYESFKTMLFAYWIGKAEEGALELKDTSVERMRSMLRKDVEVAATKLTTWRDVLKRIDPERLIRKSLAKYFGIELDDDDLDNISTAISSGDMNSIKKAYSELYDKMLIKYKGNMTGAKQAMSAIFKIQKASMLSSPSTWARAWESNAIVTGINAVSDWIGKILTKGIKRKGQYNFVGVKISDATKNFVNEAFFKSGFYDMINEGLTRYDSRSDDVKISKKDKSSYIVRMMANNIAISLSRNYVLGGKADKFINWVFKMQSDDPFIKRSFARYLGKIIESQKIDITKGFTQEVLNAASAAYTQAAYDYVHRNNFMSKLEKWMRTENPKMYMGYKLIFPFANSGWNWFMEALDLTPIQLVNNCLKLIKMEKLIEDAENKRQKGDFSGVDPRFMEFITRRKIGKGVIGTVLFGIGIALGMAGAIDIDDDDDKLKLRVFDYYVDISKTFGSSALLLGAAFTNPSKGSWLDAFESACNLTFEDSVLTTVMDTFRYDNTPYAYLTKLPGNVIMGFVPNLWKSVVRMINYKKIKYDNNFMGTLQYYIYTIVPGIYKSDWFEKQIDPFTGEEEVRYSNNFLVRLLNTVSPYTIKDYKPSDIELAFRSLGIKKGNLKGIYEDIGKLDYETLNRKYGELNYKLISDLLNDKTSYKVKNKDGKYVELKWSKMNSEQKESALTSITSKNASYAKIFTWTDSGHKYYCSSNERLELAKLGITKNIYIGKDKQFVK